MKPIVSYPKSGRTWLRYACHLAGCEPEFTHDGIHTAAEFMGVSWDGPDPDLIKKPVIFLHRDPRDTVISFYFQILRKDCIPGRKTWRRAIKRVKDGEITLPPIEKEQFVRHPIYGIEAICRFNRTWLNNMHPKSTVITYEALKAEPEVEFKTFFDALGVEADIPDIIEKTSFDAMKALQDQEDGHLYRLTKKKGDPESGKVRKGKVGGYTEYLEKPTCQWMTEVVKKYKLGNY